MYYNHENGRTFIIAEIGVNHNGDVNLAKKLIDEAIKSGANAVKFQTFNADKLLSTNKVEKAPYQKRDGAGNQYEMLKNLELNYDNFCELKSYCDHKSIEFISTPYDIESVEMLKKLGVKTIKIASADIVNRPLIDKVLECELDVILAVGMASYFEIERTVKYIRSKNEDINLAILHCTTSYPTNPEDVNMKVLIKLMELYGQDCTLGYSDHTIGNEASILAVSLGAKIIEKHFTLNKGMQGPDHFASAEPYEMKSLVESIRKIEQAVGSDEKNLTETESINIKVMRRSIHASVDITQGSIISLDMLSFSRPYDGLELWDYDELIGKKTLKVIEKGKPILRSDVN